MTAKLETAPEIFMAEALREASRAAEKGEVPVGAVVVLNGRIVSRAHNEVEGGYDPTAHAEVLALRRAAEVLGSWRLDGASLYVTLEPCPMCIGAILLSRVDSVYFGAHDQEQGAVGSVFDLSAHPELPHEVKVFSGVRCEECSEVLKTFFAQRRLESSSTCEESSAK